MCLNQVGHMFKTNLGHFAVSNNGKKVADHVFKPGLFYDLLGFLFGAKTGRS